MKARLEGLTFNREGRQVISFSTSCDFRNMFDSLFDADVSVDIKKYRKRRSLDANAYFHVLAHKIAEKAGISDEEAKANLVISYGALARDEEGQVVGFKLPENIDVGMIYPYTKCFGEREEDGKKFYCYLCYKHTHLLDTKEMSRLIDGAAQTAKDMGIETETPDEIERLKSLWGV